MKNTKTVLVTGSSGYVASELFLLLKETNEVIGVDLRPSELTNWVVDIASSDFCLNVMHSLFRCVIIAFVSL